MNTLAPDNVLHLDARLRSAVCLVRQGSIAADIGCDHGKLSAVLACSGRCPHVIAADLREGPLSVARANLERAGCSEKVELRLGSGLTVLRPGEAQDIVIAGMGAETIIEILSGAVWVRDPAVRLILVPATKHSRLRQWLAREGFGVQKEVLSCVAGRYYTAIAAGYCGSATEPDGIFCVCGLTRQDPLFIPYIKQQLTKIYKYLRSEDIPDRRGTEALAALLEEMLRSEEKIDHETPGTV